MVVSQSPQRMVNCSSGKVRSRRSCRIHLRITRFAPNWEENPTGLSLAGLMLIVRNDSRLFLAPSMEGGVFHRECIPGTGTVSRATGLFVVFLTVLTAAFTKKSKSAHRNQPVQVYRPKASSTDSLPIVACPEPRSYLGSRSTAEATPLATRGSLLWRVRVFLERERGPRPTSRLCRTKPHSISWQVTQRRREREKRPRPFH
jgi:hypothetical protein